jgi:hypothetical protein
VAKSKRKLKKKTVVSKGRSRKAYSNPPIRKVSKTSGWIKATAVRFVKKPGKPMQVLVRRAPRRKRKK